MEFKLLQFLIENRGEVHSRDKLLDEVWGYDAMPSTERLTFISPGSAKTRRQSEISAVYSNRSRLGYKFAA
jgi:DNA-binding response OmpR family regulator